MSAAKVAEFAFLRDWAKRGVSSSPRKVFACGGAWRVEKASHHTPKRGRTEAGVRVHHLASGATREDLVVVSFWWAEKSRFHFMYLLPANHRYL
jgi:hypothetical protein